MALFQCGVPMKGSLPIQDAFKHLREFHGLSWPNMRRMPTTPLVFEEDTIVVIRDCGHFNYLMNNAQKVILLASWNRGVKVRVTNERDNKKVAEEIGKMVVMVRENCKVGCNVEDLKTLVGRLHHGWVKACHLGPLMKEISNQDDYMSADTETSTDDEGYSKLRDKKSGAPLYFKRRVTRHQRELRKRRRRGGRNTDSSDDGDDANVTYSASPAHFPAMNIPVPPPAPEPINIPSIQLNMQPLPDSIPGIKKASKAVTIVTEDADADRRIVDLQEKVNNCPMDMIGLPEDAFEQSSDSDGRSVPSGSSSDSE